MFFWLSSFIFQGKKDHPNWDDNYQFYMNHIPSKPDGMVIYYFSVIILTHRNQPNYRTCSYKRSVKQFISL